MGFVTEYTDDKAREFLKQYGLPNWRKWTLDRERDIYLVHVNTTIQDEIWEDYCMIYKSAKIEINLQNRSCHHTDVKGKEIRTLQMFINSIVAPKQLKPYRDDIVAAIREAFTQLHSVNLIQGKPPVKSNFNFVIMNMDEPRFGLRELHNGRIKLLEIIDGKESVMLHTYIVPFSQFELSNILADAERQCRENQTELVDFLVGGKERIWGIVTQETFEKYGEETPDWCWNRETQKLYRPGERQDD